ncbi:MAG TPA: hypothetical protein VMU09_05045, partial [Acidimicrobiales bacterium]|nr:hypothetical protein [Acidimicrobiales bacterium]
AVDPDLVPDLVRLTNELEEGRRIPQPRLRHRFQVDKVGLLRSRHRLVGEGEALHFEFDDGHGLPAQQVLAAVYAAGQLDPAVRHGVMAALRRAVRWQGGADDDLIAALAGVGVGRPLSTRALRDPRSWAWEVLGLDATATSSASTGAAAGAVHGTSGSGVGRATVQRRFREQVRAAHPDHGGDAEAAAQRIAELTEARRILLG